MPKRNKKIKKKKESKIIKSVSTDVITQCADNSACSLETSSEIDCNDSKIEVEIGMPKVYNRSNSLFGIFGLLSAQKPKVVRIKKEPEEVEELKTRDTSHIETNSSDQGEILGCSNSEENSSRIKLKKVSVVVEDIFNPGKKENPDVRNKEMKQRSTDANENFTIIDEFFVEKDEELDITNQRNTSLKEINTLPERKENDNITEINPMITIANGNSSENTNGNLSINANENLSTNANENLSTNAYRSFVADGNEHLSFNDKFFVKKERDNLLVNVNEVIEKENNTDMNIFEDDQLPVEEDSSNNVTKVTKQRVTDVDKNLLCNEYSMKKDLVNMEIMNETVKREDTSEISMPVICDVFVKTEKQGSLNDIEQNIKVERSSAEDFEISSVNLVSTIAVKEQTANLWNMDTSLDELWMESDGKVSFRDKNVVEKYLEESNTDDDIMILKVICKKCQKTHTRASSCAHFPVNVE